MYSKASLLGILGNSKNYFFSRVLILMVTLPLSTIANCLPFVALAYFTIYACRPHVKSQGHFKRDLNIGREKINTQSRSLDSMGVFVYSKSKCNKLPNAEGN
jgi:hypothetical protein